MSGDSCYLLDLPNEVLHSILREVDLFSLGPLIETCSTLNTFIKSNKLLLKELYLSNFDDPRKRHGDNFEWDTQLIKFIRLHKILLSTKIYQKTFNLEFIAENVSAMLRLADFAELETKTFVLKESENGNRGIKSSGPKAATSKSLVSRNVAFLTDMFSQNMNVDSILCKSSLFENAGTDMQLPAGTEHERQLSAKLHCLYGVPVCASAQDSSATHPYARAKVYDIRRYTERTMWGPFLDDGTQNVDWEKVEAVMVDLAYNVELFHNRVHGQFPILWSTPWRGAVPYSYFGAPITSPESQPDIPLASLDPYNVSGTWMRIVCFLDYTDFFAYNFAFQRAALHEDVRPINTEEAIRIICMKFKVTKIEPPGESDGKDLPVVYFDGTSHSLHAAWDPNANSDIRGTVRLTPEGEVRWTTFSIYSGEERWRTEAIQVGGVQSRRGVFGHWFDKDYDARGPAGPTAFWKLTNQIAEGRHQQFHHQ